MVEVEPQPRIDTLVRVPGGGEARRTVRGNGVVRRQARSLRPGASARRERPEGNQDAERSGVALRARQSAYMRAAIGDAKLSVSVALRGSGGTGAITGAIAVFADDPSGEPMWIQLHMQAHLGWPAGLSYRVVALTPPDAVQLRYT